MFRYIKKTREKKKKEGGERTLFNVLSALIHTDINGT